MTESNWTQEPEPAERGTVTKTVPPVPPAPPAVSDDKLRAGIATLGKHAQDARQSHAAEIKAKQRELAPYVKEAAALQQQMEAHDAVYRPRMEEARRLARSSDMRRFYGVDDALAALFDKSSAILTMLSSSVWSLRNLPNRVRDLTWNDIQTRRYLDIPDVVKGLRDVPERIPRYVSEVEHLLESINVKIAGQKPT